MTEVKSNERRRGLVGMIESGAGFSAGAAQGRTFLIGLAVDWSRWVECRRRAE